VIDWLLDRGGPWTVHRTLIDLLGCEEDSEPVVQARKALLSSPPIQSLFATQRADGGWDRNQLVKACGSPHQGNTLSVLSVLADFGLDVSDDRVARACEYVLGFQSETGGFCISDTERQSYTCYSAETARALAALGLAEDERVLRAYAHFKGTIRLDDGWIHSKSAQIGKRRQHIPSCPHATLNVLWALSEHPGYRDDPMAHAAAEVVFDHWTSRERPYGWGIGTQFMRLKYPFTWYGLLKVVAVMTRLPSLAGDPRLGQMLESVIDRGDEEGRYRAESIYRYWDAFDFAQKRKPSPWITLLVLRAQRDFSRS
jgi:hypothetical protein